MRSAALLLLLSSPIFAATRAEAPAAETVTPLPAIFKRPRLYDGKFLCVAGKTDTLFQKYSRHGHHYFTVWVSEGGQRMKIFGFGFPTFKEGETIEACGKYLQMKEHSGRIFYDEFTAAAILTGAAMRAGRVVLARDGVHPAPRARP